MDDKELIAIKMVIAKLDNIEKYFFDMSAIVNNLYQLQKQMMYLISKGAEPFNQAPKGEVDTLACNECGSRIFKNDVMKKARLVGGDVITYDLCRKCFYGRREKGKIEIDD